jgi:Protein of unknown function (DUF1588)/Protein of unknown function (DUF1592)/Protein of unknown function (DUF1585)
MSPFRFLVSTAVILVGCTGSITGGVLPPTQGPSGSGSGTSGSGGGSGSVDPVIPIDGRGSNYSFEGKSSQVRRLTREELLTSINLLTGQTLAKADLPAEQKELHRVMHMAGQSYVSSELPKLREAIFSFSSAQAPAVLTRSACKKTLQAQRDCLMSWAVTLSEVAWRHTLADSEKTSLATLISEADGTLVNDVNAVEGVLDAVLFAPSFLYRNELGSPALNDVEIATKLSFTAAGVPPDTELMAAAKNGSLRSADIRLSHYNRLAATPAGARAHALLVLDWLGASDVNFQSKNPSVVDGLPSTFASDIRTNAIQTLESVLKSSRPTLPEMLGTTSYQSAATVTALTATAKRGGIDFGDTASTKRQGLLMHPYVIAAHAKEGAASIFAIGSFLRDALLCQKLGSPPANATSLVRTDTPSGLSQRQALEYKTSPSPSCISCHGQFAPLGFAFAAFDSVGRWRINEPTGAAWDFNGTSPLSWSSQSLSFSDPASLSDALASSPQVQGCFAHRLMAIVLGHEPSTREINLSKQLDEVATSSQGNPFEVLRAMVQSPEFIAAN